MNCKYWNSETYSCKIKGTTIAPEEIEICENCKSYKSADTIGQIFCNNCEKNFQLTEDHIIDIKGKEFVKCPQCQEVIGIKRDSEVLR